MRKVISLLLIAALAVPLSASIADAKKKPKRVSREATAVYDTPAPGISGGPFFANCGSPSTGCVSFTTSSTERFAQFAIEDTTGQSAAGSVWQGTGTNLVLITEFCGKTEEAISIPAGEAITVTAHAGASPSNVCPGIATSGLVRATFSNLP